MCLARRDSFPHRSRYSWRSGLTDSERAARPVPPAAKKEDDRAERLDEMKQIAGSFQAVAIDGGTRVRPPWRRDALYRWNDPTRDFSDGALWFWTSSGRPIGVVAIELYPQNEPSVPSGISSSRRSRPGRSRSKGASISTPSMRTFTRPVPMAACDGHR